VINFDLNSPNQLLINPKTSIDEKNTLFELKTEFEKTFGVLGYFLLASSGSSQKSDESVKLVALKKESVLNSGRRFNQYFNANHNAHWGLVLPEFHVAGLGVKARAFLAGARVFIRNWQVEGLADWINENNIYYISMVPTQIYDLVQRQLAAPFIIKKIFVGASFLSADLYFRAKQLGWPIVETYGMTETASMIAVKESELYHVLPGVEVKTESELLSIKCNSLMTARIQKLQGQICIQKLLCIQKLQAEAWYQTEDRAEFVTSGDLSAFKLLGRDSDYIKILGEGVSLRELRRQLADIILVKNSVIGQIELLAVDDERAGFKLILAVENALDLTLAKTLLEHYNNECRAYEKIQQCVVIEKIPRSLLGKLKTDELKHRVIEALNKGLYG